MTDCRAVCYLIFLNFYDAPFLVGLLGKYGDMDHAWRLIVVNSTVHDFLRLLRSDGTISANRISLRVSCITYIYIRLADEKVTPFRAPFDLEKFLKFKHTAFATEITLGSDRHQ